MLHTVTFKFFTAQKLLQTILRHNRLKGQRTGEWAPAIGFMCVHTYELCFPYLDKESDEYGQHGKGKSDEVENRDGGESYLGRQNVF